MRAFTCGHCGQLLFFENSLCLRCRTPQGFDTRVMGLVALEGETAEAFRRCENASLAACNGLLGPGEEAETLCRSCRLTSTRPADGDAAGLELFRDTEVAKRRLLFGLMDLRLPVDETRLRFDLLSSTHQAVVTGHADGLVTIDLAESDDAQRTSRQAAMGEPYRTMLGHFRHEIAHYYQPIVVATDEEWERCRALFGDERADYSAAMDAHYRKGPPQDWAREHVSAYATMHPWEDWAETFAHYLHIRDTLQTAGEFGLAVLGPARAPTAEFMAAPPLEVEDDTLEEIIAQWLPLTYALNQVNRSMGAGDLYPFTLKAKVIEKLAYVHERVRAVGALGVRV